MNEIISGRFTTGEYFIATPVQLVDNVFTFTDPILFEVVTADTDKQYSIAMRSLIPLGRPGQKVTINADHIMFCIDDLDESIISQYQAAISQIEVAKKIPPDLEVVK